MSNYLDIVWGKNVFDDSADKLAAIFQLTTQIEYLSKQ